VAEVRPEVEQSGPSTERPPGGRDVLASLFCGIALVTQQSRTDVEEGVALTRSCLGTRGSAQDPLVAFSVVGQSRGIGEMRNDVMAMGREISALALLRSKDNDEWGAWEACGQHRHCHDGQSPWRACGRGGSCHGQNVEARGRLWV
jgi:hypothetical protein